MNDVLLEIKNLETWFYTDEGVVRGCDRVSYQVNRGETLAPYARSLTLGQRYAEILVLV